MLFDEVNSNRRIFLKGATGSALAFGLNGCGITKNNNTPIEQCRKDTSPFIAGDFPVKADPKQKLYFDAHTHFFNARDVPVAEFLAKSLGHTLPNEIRVLVEALAPIVEALSSSLAPSCKDEMVTLCSKSNLSAQSRTQKNVALDDEIVSHREKIATVLTDELLKNIVIQDFIRRRFNDDFKMHGYTDTNEFNKDFVFEALNNGSTNWPAKYSRRKLTKLYIQNINKNEFAILNFAGLLRFAGLMLSPRHHNLRSFIKDYAEANPNTPMSGCFGALVDFKYWLNSSQQVSDMRDQVILHEQLAILSNGFLMPLVAYNPWVDIKEDDASLKTVIWAIQEHGCVGVKIYPSMGFYPYGNKELGHLENSTEERPPLGELDKKLIAFYETCRSLGVPVMAHANESMGRDGAHDKLSGTIGWTKANDLVTLNGLHVNAGHFGGDGSEKTDNLTEEFARLIDASKNLKIYADLGYWDKLPTDKNVQIRLKNVLKLHPLIGERLMYGSDWHMISKEPLWAQYPSDVFKVLLDIDESGNLANRVFGLNILDCFGLSDKPTNFKARTRLRDIYNKRRTTIPAWLI